MNKIRRIMGWIVILLMLSAHTTQAQCTGNESAQGYTSMQGVVPGPSNYYRNLIIQDLALANRQQFHEVDIRFNYSLNYSADTCDRNDYKLKINNFEIEIKPINYFGFDISHALAPGSADLVFYLRNKHRIILDSLVLKINFDENGFIAEISSNFKVDAAEEIVSIRFSGAVFHYDKLSYEWFRDRVLQVDEYFAASALADSTLVWTYKGFLEETGKRYDLLVKLTELERIIRHINPARFHAIFNNNHDPEGLTQKYHRLRLIKTRYTTLLRARNPGDETNAGILAFTRLIDAELDWLDHYHQMAFHIDYRFLNFLERLSTPGFSNSDLVSYQKKMRYFTNTGSIDFSRIGNVLFTSFKERGNRYENSGDQTRALAYYKAALSVARILHLGEQVEHANSLVCNMKLELVNSYLGISRRTLSRDNAAMAVQYLQYARDIVKTNNLTCRDRELTTEYENWLYGYFTERTPAVLAQGEYEKAFSFLKEIQSFCALNELFTCPDRFTSWMKQAQQGIYNDLLRKIKSLIERDELAEAEQVYKLALGMRLDGSELIDRSEEEEKFEIKFRQALYDDLLEEGFRNMAREEFDIALYYFNKAGQTAQHYLPRPDNNLRLYRKSAATFFIRQLLPEIQYRSLSADFEGAGLLIGQVDMMIAEYRIPGNDPLVAEFNELKDHVLNSGCASAADYYDQLMEEVFKARDEQDYKSALKLATEAVNYSMEYIFCRIRDDQAWYQKIVLEPIAGFQEMEERLDSLSHVSAELYLEAFQELNNYYVRHKLLDQGVVLTSLFDRVIRSEDQRFLGEMTDFYLERGDYIQAMHLMERSRQSGTPSRQSAERQKAAAAALARIDAQQAGQVIPWEKMADYTGRSIWYRPFKWKYKMTWMKETGWKFSGWPLIWKK